jgi:hypothetical protein
MELFNYMLLFLLGLSFGTLLAWMVAKSRIGGRLTEAVTQSGGEIAKLEQVILGAEKELREKNAQIADLQTKLGQAERCPGNGYREGADSYPGKAATA